MEERRRKAEYRSSIRSKTLIRNALVSLMQEKPFEKITITDIVKRADINRGTFYAHFKDSREVLDKIREDAISEIEQSFYSLSPDLMLRNPRPLFETISFFLSKDGTYYKMLLCTSGIQNFLDEIKKMSLEYLLTSEYAKNIEDKGALVARLDFIISGVCGFYYDAAMGTVPITLEEAPAFISEMVKTFLLDKAEAEPEKQD